jgi:hypothetical protein
MGHDALNAQQARKYIRRAGGTANVAKQLGTSELDVIRWAREGLLDEDQSIRLQDIGCFRIHPHGVLPRSTVLLPGELDKFIRTQGGHTGAAAWLGISARTLRRYRTSQSIPPEHVADRVREELSNRLASLGVASDGAQKTPDVLGRNGGALGDWLVVRAPTREGPTVNVPFVGWACGEVVVKTFLSIDDEDCGGVVIRLTVENPDNAFLPHAEILPNGVEIHMAGQDEGACLIRALRAVMSAVTILPRYDDVIGTHDSMGKREAD